jgi:hypothetical protein
MKLDMPFSFEEKTFQDILAGVTVMSKLCSGTKFKQWGRQGLIVIGKGSAGLVESEIVA